MKPSTAGTSSNKAAPRGSPQSRGAWLFSILVHGMALVAFVTYSLLAPKPPPTVAVFELVAVEKPRLRPLAPKTPEPPVETPPESRPPEAPALVPKPKTPVVPPKPEPKVVRPTPPDTTLPVKDVPRENARTSPVQVSNAPSDPRLAMWAGRVQKMVEARWNPPTGIDVQGRTKTVISFEVARGGEIDAVEVAQGSGNTLLDDLAKRTIQRLERVVPIPPNFPGELLKVSYEFVYDAN
jgi:TonB family protein